VQYRTPEKYQQQLDLGSLACDQSHAEKLRDTVVKCKVYGWLEVLLPGQTLMLTAIPSELLMPVYQEFEVQAVSLWYCFLDGPQLIMS
jgi:hypothetical protein